MSRHRPPRVYLPGRPIRGLGFPVRAPLSGDVVAFLPDRATARQHADRLTREIHRGAAG